MVLLCSGRTISPKERGKTACRLKTSLSWTAIKFPKASPWQETVLVMLTDVTSKRRLPCCKLRKYYFPCPCLRVTQPWESVQASCHTTSSYSETLPVAPWLPKHQHGKVGSKPTCEQTSRDPPGASLRRTSLYHSHSRPWEAQLWDCLQGHISFTHPITA